MLEPNFSAWMTTAASEPHVVDSGPQTEVAQDVFTRPAHLELEIGNRELLAKNRARHRQLRCHSPHGGIKPEAGLDTHDHQVERIGQAQKDRLGPLLLPAVHHHAWQVEAYSATHGSDRHRIPRHAHLECHDRQGDHHAKEHEDQLDAKKDSYRVLVPEAGIEQLEPDLAQLFLIGRTQRLTELVRGLGHLCLELLLAAGNPRFQPLCGQLPDS